MEVGDSRPVKLHTLDMFTSAAVLCVVCWAGTEAVKKLRNTNAEGFIDTSTLVPHSEVDAVDSHVDFIFQITATLIIIEY